MLSLLAEVAAERPLLCLVDDWLPEVRWERPLYGHRRGLAHPETAEHTDPQTKPERG